MLAATLRSPTQALPSGSSGRLRTLRALFSARRAWKGCPSTITWPDSTARWPPSDCIISRWPLPLTPATPTISPARTSRLSARTAGSPRSPSTFSARIDSFTAPGGLAARSGASAAALASPTIATASVSGVRWATGPLSMRRPRRSTLTSSA